MYVRPFEFEGQKTVSKFLDVLGSKKVVRQVSARGVRKFCSDEIPQDDAKSATIEWQLSYFLLNVEDAASVCKGYVASHERQARVSRSCTNIK